MAGVDDASVLEQARIALARHEWRAAFDLLHEADGGEGLTPEGLELLAEAAWWTGQLPLSIDARERAYAAATRQGDPLGAVTAAIGLARDNLLRMSMSVAQAWLKRADRLLEGTEEGVTHGWLATARAFAAALEGDTQETLAQAERAYQIGRRLGNRELEAFALSEKAAALLAAGRVEEGLPLADEATLVAISGEIEPQAAGGICCATIEACTAIGDLRRAAEWTEAQDRWCRREGINGYPGMCRLFRSEIKRLRGAWPEAEAEARLASDELRGYIPAAAGVALYQIGEIRLNRGDLPAAEEALMAAHALGEVIEPAFARLRLAQGRPEAAATSIRRALEERGRHPSWRAAPDSEAARLALLPAQVQIALAVGDTATARTGAAELDALAERFGTALARGHARTAAGAVALADGRAEAAVQELGQAIDSWNEVGAPYELARARRLLGDAYLAAGEADRAGVELRSARSGFEQLGAALDLRAVDAVLAALGGEADDPAVGTAASRVTRTFVFTDIVDSTRLAEALGDDAWDRVLRWHDRTLRAASAEQGGEEVKATGDGFFFAFPSPDAAVEAALAIQRRLATHRAEEGFAPEVRIGVHQAKANRVGLDYLGIGVNQAARIGSAAGGGEILVSAPTFDAARHAFRASRPRRLELKGVSAPIDVVSVEWR